MGAVGGGEQTYEMVKLALKLGYRHFDTVSHLRSPQPIGLTKRMS